MQTINDPFDKKDPLLFAHKGPICTIYKLYEPADLGLRNEPGYFPLAQPSHSYL